MRVVRPLVFGFFLGIWALGCGDASLIKARGRVVKDGQAYTLAAGEGLRMIFLPQAAPDGEHYDSYPAVFHPEEGTFEVVGKEGKGLPAGKYTVSLELMKNKEDLFKGHLFGKNSPILLEVSQANHDLLIDLDAINLDNLLKQPAKPKKTPVRRKG
jgi:hypothetical protein